jgi:hypothetical protein
METSQALMSDVRGCRFFPAFHWIPAQNGHFLPLEWHYFSDAFSANNCNELHRFIVVRVHCTVGSGGFAKYSPILVKTPVSAKGRHYGHLRSPILASKEFWPRFWGAKSHQTHLLEFAWMIGLWEIPSRKNLPS